MMPSVAKPSHQPCPNVLEQDTKLLLMTVHASLWGRQMRPNPSAAQKVSTAGEPQRCKRVRTQSTRASWDRPTVGPRTRLNSIVLILKVVAPVARRDQRIVKK